VGNLAHLREAAARASDPGATAGVGHTRWATHGRVTEANAHPHADGAGTVAVVMNGIIENYMALKAGLQDRGAVFRSDTDTEVLPHLIAERYDGDLAAAVRSILPDLAGHFAFVAIHADEPGRLVAARRECPLVIGVGDGEQFVASAIPAFLRETRDVVLIEDDEVVALEAGGLRIWNGAGELAVREPQRVDLDEDAAERGGFETFMLKEIHEQADAVAETLAGRLDAEGIDLGDIGIPDDFLRNVRRVVIVACGTSYHAGLVGRYSIETWARVPCEMDIASEFRYRNPLVDEHDLVIGISQSGETADTLAAMRLARERGAKVLSITNIMGSQATRDADGVIFTRAGLEIGVAATKTFVAQVIAMQLFALKLAGLHGTLGPEITTTLITQLRRMPHMIAELVDSVDEQARQIAGQFKDCGFFLYLGRHVGLAICLEGALKLKEISYIPTDAYAAGEMKHGPIALLDENTPVMCVATDSPVLDKMMSNIAEVQARGAHVVAIATEGTHVDAEQVIKVPRTDWLLQPALAIVPLQLIAYHIACARGLNVDQPRNLAKTVTVE
jgi:glucosamine--fructose-6-phosphate aminotransferase (isomerizing)